jgi:hypothetical protein
VSWILDLFGDLVSWAGVPLPQRKNIDYEGAVTVADDPVKKRTVVTVGGAGTSPTFGAIIATSLNVGEIVEGPSEEAGGATQTSSSTTSSPIVALPLASGSAATVPVVVVGTDGTNRFHLTVPGFVSTLGGSPTIGGGTAASLNTFPLSPSASLAWSSGTLSLIAAGPSVTVTGAADNGSGKVRLTVSGPFNGGLPALSTWASTISMVISGVAGTVEANGTHAATFVDASHLDLPSVAFVNAYSASSGTVVLAAPPTIFWGGWMQVVVA